MKRLWLRWFISFAIVGGLVPIILKITGPPRGYSELFTLFLVWPGFIIIIITDPSSSSDKLIMYSLSIGLNAVL